jgi:hypothetical protein
MTPKLTNILKFEGLAFFIASLWTYHLIGLNWWLFAAFILVPDFFMLGYVRNSKLGATIYNLGHTYLFPGFLFGIYFVLEFQIFLPISIIWFAHISMDRMLGYGLKYDDSFRHTHLGEINISKK